MVLRAERVTDVLTVHGEGPLWTADTWAPFDPPELSGADGVLRFVDMAAGLLLTLDPATGRTASRHVGRFAACVRPRRDGGLVMALWDSFALLDPGAETFRDLGRVWTASDVRFNEGGCDADGSFYAGSTQVDMREGGGAVHRLDPDGTVSTVYSGVTVSNGLIFSEDGSRAYYTDTPTGRIDVIDIDPGTRAWVDRRPFITFTEEDGWSDGFCLDAEGGIWVAMWEGHAVRRYDTDGALTDVVRLPVTYPTCPAFGGPGFDELYVTTSRRDVPDGAEPEAGALFRIDAGVKGAPVLTFAG